MRNEMRPATAFIGDLSEKEKSICKLCPFETGTSDQPTCGLFNLARVMQQSDTPSVSLIRSLGFNETSIPAGCPNGYQVS